MATTSTSKPDRSGDDGQTLQVSSLQVDTHLEQDIFDARGILLLAAGSTVTDRFLAQLKRHRITAVTAKRSPGTSRPSDNKTAPASAVGVSEPGETAMTKQLDAVIEQGSFESLTIPTTSSKTPSRLELNQLRKEVKTGLKCVHETAEYYDDLVGKVSRGEPTDLSQMCGFVQRFSDLVDKDTSLGPLVASLQSDAYEYISKQGIKTAVLAVAMANHLEVQSDWILDVGIAALVQDLGMMRVPESIRLAQRRLTEDEMLQIKYHPIYSLNVLEKTPSIGQLVHTVVYQAHERCDGSGYPRGRSGRSIHPLARILAVADTYAAMTTDKPHRKAMSPYAAIKAILIEAHKGRLDRDIVRTFLDYLSVFPVGGRVKLSDGRVGEVIRSNGSQHTRPVVLLLNDDGSESDMEVDLAKTDRLQITEYLEDAADDQRRESA